MLKNLLHYILLIGILLGLAGQGIASAASPCAMMAQTQVVHSSTAKAMPDMTGCAMSADEMKIATSDTHKVDKGSTPCKAMGLCCLAVAGSGAIAALDTTQNMDRLPARAATVLPRPAESFPLGWNILPELDPPSLLG